MQMSNFILYLGLALSALFLLIVLPIQVIVGNFKPAYIGGIVIWGIVALGCVAELRRRKGN